MKRFGLLVGLFAVAVSVPLTATCVFAQAATESEPKAAEQSPAGVPLQGAAQAPSQNQGDPPGSGDPRFAFYRIDYAFVRLDLHSGQVASCSRLSGVWACTTAREDRLALESEIARLQHDNATLKKALLDRGAPLPEGMASVNSVSAAPAVDTAPRPPQSVPPVASTSPGSSKSPESDTIARDEAELDRVITVVEHVWRRVVDMVSNMQRDVQKKMNND